MKAKILLWGAVSVLTTAFAADAPNNDAAGNAPNSGKLPAITLSDGTKLTLLGVTYGRHHVAPNFEEIGGNIRNGNWINRPNDATVVWLELEHKPGTWPDYALLVSDEANTACITSEVTTRSHVRDGVEVHGFLLQAFPRWDKQIFVRIASVYGQELSKERLVIGNPQPRFFGSETVEPLPDTQSDGDVQVTLTKLVAGAPLPPYQRRNGMSPDDPQSKCVRIAFDFKQKGQSVTNWRPWVVSISDAAGNHLETTMQYQDNEFMRQHMMRPAAGHPIVYGTNDDYKGYYFKPGLWPDEPAWKVRLEFTRTSGFNDDEILTLTNLPVRQGGQKDWDEEWTWEPGRTDPSFGNYTVNGVQFKLFPPLLRPDPYQTNQLRLGVIMRAMNDIKGMRIALLKATDDQGRELWSPLNPTASYNSTFEFVNPHDDVKALNLQFALHKSRFVEFNVKPARE